ncbi:MAG: GAF domain-containing protein [Candidatus Acidiferrales bacterium]|jgi:GAF domain-containing protein
MAKTLVSEIERLADAIGENDAGSVETSLHHVAERIAEVLRVKKDEVAILILSDRMRVLRFLIPERLRHAGVIPLSSINALAARTARQGRPEIINHFADARHLSVSEALFFGYDRGDEVIQKIMCVPIKIEDQVVGVIQLSRKGKSFAKAGPDFTERDLRELLPLSRALGKLLRLFPGD